MEDAAGAAGQSAGPAAEVGLTTPKGKTSARPATRPHTLFITEFLLNGWAATQTCKEFEILTMQRRSLAMHDAFKVVVAGRHTRLQPDAMLLYRQQGKGMMCCFVEVDNPSSSFRILMIVGKRENTANMSRWQSAATESVWGLRRLALEVAPHRVALPL